jgi:glycosyltransferase involved in cell wall biosynthesis
MTTRVLLVAAASATSGGGERHVADLLRGLPERAIEPVLACPSGGDLPALARELGIATEPLEIASGLRLGGVTALRGIVSRLRPDVVHAHGSRAAFYTRLGDPEARRRVVYTLHGIHVDRAGSSARRAAFLGLERWLRPRTARFVAVCRADLERGGRLGVLDPERADVVYNGIPMPGPALARGVFRAEIGVAAEAPLALAVGRFHEQKDQATLLRAWMDVIGIHPDAVLALLGSGELGAELHALADRFGIAGSVRFVAPRAGLEAAYADADVFALSSLWEGLPYVVLEAMAYGLPVASTAVDGIPEAVVDGESGLLVPPSDPAALAGAIARLLGDGALRERLGEAARGRVAGSFSLTEMLDRTVRVYDAVVSER